MAEFPKVFLGTAEDAGKRLANEVVGSLRPKISPNSRLGTQLQATARRFWEWLIRRSPGSDDSA